MKKIIILILLTIVIPIITLLLKINVKEEEIVLYNYFSPTIRVKRLKKNIIETIPLNQYIVGVLAGEMPASFHEEALKAQAVASRSYALKRIEYNSKEEYDIVDSIQNQVYLDDAYLKEVWKNSYTTKINKLKKAVNETYNEYLEYNGAVIDALFFSTSNGYTEDSKLVFGFNVPYLKSVQSTWDQKTSTAFKSNIEISLQELYEKLSLPYQKNLQIKILKKSTTNRILELSINEKTFTGRELYNKLGLRSTDFEIQQQGTNVIIKTTGYGHGVGMSQYGALGMAKEGYNYQEILKHYYQNTNLKKL